RASRRLPRGANPGDEWPPCAWPSVRVKQLNAAHYVVALALREDAVRDRVEDLFLFPVVRAQYVVQVLPQETRRRDVTHDCQFEGGHQAKDLTVISPHRHGGTRAGGRAGAPLELGEDERLFETDVTAEAVGEQGECCLGLAQVAGGPGVEGPALEPVQPV